MDEEYRVLPQIISIVPNRFPCKLTMINIKSTEFTFYPDVFITSEFYVTEEVKKCLLLFEPNMEYREYVFFDRTYKKDRLYISLALSEYDRIEDVPMDKSIFKVKNGDKFRVIIRQDAFECIFKRGAKGVTVKEIAK